MIRYFSFLVFSMALSAQSALASTPTRSVVYKEFKEDGKETGKALKLFIFEPEKKSDTKTCVIFYFGGGWVGGSPRQFYQQADRLAKQGILAICADYRTKKSHGTRPQDAVSDAQDAVNWVCLHSKDLGIDKNKIVAAGGFAGGHLAACTGVLDAEGFSEASSDTHSKPNAMVLFNPVLDTTAKGYGTKAVGENKTEISPCHHVRKRIVPTLVLHGTADKTVPFENAKRFETLMKKAGNDCTLVAYEGLGHGFFNGKEFRSKSDNKNFENTMKEIDKFLQRLEFMEKN